MSIFVGRLDELSAWTECLASSVGQCLLIVGPQGMGKSVLLDRMVELARSHPDLRCGAIRYDVLPSDSFESVATMMLDDAFQAAGKSEGSFAATNRRRKQWEALVALLPRGDKITTLLSVLRRNPDSNPRLQLLARLQLISDRLPTNGRAVFFIDPDKYLHRESTDAWRVLARELPDKCKLVIAQRDDDRLASDQSFLGLENVTRIHLDVLKQEDVEELVRLRRTVFGDPIEEVASALEQYNCHPYAVHAAIDLIASGRSSASELVADPTPNQVSLLQWRSICNKGEDAIRVFSALAVLREPTTASILTAVAAVATETFHKLLADDFLRGLVRDRIGGFVIYHSLLAERILAEMVDNILDYHDRAIDAFRKTLTRSDTAPIRLPIHMREVYGDSGFVDGVLESAPILIDRGLYSTCREMATEALSFTVNDPLARAKVLQSVSTVDMRQGHLDAAEAAIHETIEVSKKAGDKRTTAMQSFQLAAICKSRGEYSAAESHLQAARTLFQEIGDLTGLSQCSCVLADIQITRGAFDQAARLYTDALNAAETAGDTNAFALTLTKIASLNQSRGQMDLAMDALNEAKRMFEATGYVEGVAGAIGRIAGIHQVQGRFDEAISAHNQAIKMETELGHPSRLSEEYAGLAEVHLKQGNIDKAEPLLRSALDLDLGMGLQTTAGARYSALARIHHMKGDLRSARFMSESALTIFRNAGDVQAIAIELCNLGAVLISESAHSKAISCYERALELLKDIDRPDIRAFALGNLGVIHRINRKWQESLLSHEEARSLYQTLGDPVNAALQTAHLGRLAISRGDRDEGLQYLNQSLETFREYECQDRIENVSRFLANLESAP